MDCFAALAMTWWELRFMSNSKYTSAFSRHDLPELCLSSSSLKRGSRECRMRAAPAVSCAKCTSKKAHEHTGQRRTSDIPCAIGRTTRMSEKCQERKSRAFAISDGNRLV